MNESDNKTDATAVITTTITAVHQQSLHQQIAAEVTHVLFVGCCITTKTKIFLFYSMRISCPFLLCIPVVKWNKNFDLKKKTFFNYFYIVYVYNSVPTERDKKKTTKKHRRDTSRNDPKQNGLWWRRFFLFSGDFSFYVVVVGRVKRESATWLYSS